MIWRALDMGRMLTPKLVAVSVKFEMKISQEKGFYAAENRQAHVPNT